MTQPTQPAPADVEARKLIEETRIYADAFQFEVGTWAESVFTRSSMEAICTHLRREAVELSEDVEDGAEEAADIFLLLLHYAHRRGFSLMDEARTKLEINKRRQWGEPDAEGVVEHLKGIPV